MTRDLIVKGIRGSQSATNRIFPGPHLRRIRALAGLQTPDPSPSAAPPWGAVGTPRHGRPTRRESPWLARSAGSAPRPPRRNRQCHERGVGASSATRRMPMAISFLLCHIARPVRPAARPLQRLSSHLCSNQGPVRTRSNCKAIAIPRRRAACGRRSASPRSPAPASQGERLFGAFQDWKGLIRWAFQHASLATRVLSVTRRLSTMSIV